MDFIRVISLRLDPSARIPQSICLGLTLGKEMNLSDYSEETGWQRMFYVVEKHLLLDWSLQFLPRPKAQTQGK